MSNMKDLLGDVTLGEFEEMRKTALEKFKGLDANGAMKLWDSDTDILYDLWVELKGAKLASKWVEERGEQPVGVRIIEGVDYLIDNFIFWLGEIK